MKLRPLCLIAIICMLFACSKEKELCTTIEDCPNLEGTSILSEADKATTCIYLEVFRYQSAIYTLCECCVCDKAAIPTNCMGEGLCEITQDCLIDFYQNAEYLFSVTSQ